MPARMIMGGASSAFHDVAALGEHVTNARPQVALQLNSIVGHGSPGPARALQLLAELLQELFVLRQPVDDGDGLATATLLLHSHFRDDSRRDRGISSAARAALAVPLRPATHRTLARGCRGVHETRVVLESH